MQQTLKKNVHRASLMPLLSQSKLENKRIAPYGTIL